MIHSLAALLATPWIAAGAGEELPACAPGWRLEVIAVAPEIKHPTVVTFAPDGRFFVAEDPMDISAPANAALGRVLCFHPDGRTTEFASGLHAVFGMQYIEGRLFVLHNPKLTVLRDGGDVGRDRRDLIESTNPEPWALDWNDHVPANFRLAMDGFLYVSVGDKGVYDCKGRDGKAVSLFGGGILRLRPEATELEVFSTGTRNHLDAAVNDEDEVFTYDNTDEKSWWSRVTHMVDGGYYGYPWDHRPPQPHILPCFADYGPGAATAALAYNEDGLPGDHRGNLFLCDFGRREVLRVRLERQGGTYRAAAREGILFRAPADFRPVGLGLAPDGVSFVVADWRHDDVKAQVAAGRLLRLTWTGKSSAAPKPAWYIPAAQGQPFTATDGELLEALRHPSHAVRLCAQRRLAERGTRLIEPLRALLGDGRVPPAARWHAVWALDAIDGGEAARPAMLAALRDPDAGLRRQAARQLGQRRAPAAAPPLAMLLTDADAAVRFHAATALGRIAEVASVPALAGALADADPFARFAAFTALRRIGQARPAAWGGIGRGLESDEPRIREGTLLALRDAYDPAAAATLIDFVAAAARPAEVRATALETLAGLYKQVPAWRGEWWAYHPIDRPRPRQTVAWAGTAAIHAALLGRLDDGAASVRRAAAAALGRAREPVPRLREALGRERDAAARLELVRAIVEIEGPGAADVAAAAIASWREHPECAEEAARAAARAAGDRVRGALLQVLGAAEAPARLLARSLESLGEIGKEDDAAAVAPFLEAKDPELRRGAARTLGKLRSPSALPALIGAFRDEEVKLEAARALTRTPDVRALDAYLFGLGVPITVEREPFRRAMQAIAGEAKPLCEERAAEGKIQREPLLELRRLYAVPVPVRAWRVAAAMPAGAVLATAGGPGPETDADWIPQQATGAEGKLTVPGLPGANAWATFAGAPLTSGSARIVELQVRQEGALDLWLNGEKLVERRPGAWAGEPRRVRARLKKGASWLAVRLEGGAGQDAALAVLVPEPDGGPLFAEEIEEVDLEAYAAPARSGAGDPARGRTLFFDLQAAACSKCHAVQGQGGQVGPDLSGVGAQFDRGALIESVLYPSRRVRGDYQQVIVVTRAGEVRAGAARGETEEAITLVDAEGKLHAIPRSEIDRRESSDLSLMPEGLHVSFSPRGFADLIAFLESLRTAAAR